MEIKGVNLYKYGFCKKCCRLFKKNFYKIKNSDEYLKYTKFNKSELCNKSTGPDDILTIKSDCIYKWYQIGSRSIKNSKKILLVLK